jgi:AcrR family transcriptional regulator
MAKSIERRAGATPTRLEAEPGLSRRGIAAVALRLIDEEGLAAFSLRNLAKAMGVSAPALYWHVPSRNAVLAEAIALVVADVTPPADLAWQDFLRQLIRNFRAAMHRHPNAAPLLGAEIVANSATDLDLVEGILRALAAAGFTGERLVFAYNTTCVAMVGFAFEELCPMPDDAARWQTIVRDRLAQAAPRDYPLLSGHLALLSNRGFMVRWQSGVAMPMEGSFAFFVDVFIAGLEAAARTA